MKTVSYELASELLEALKYCVDHGSMTGDEWVKDTAVAAISKADAAMAEPQPDADGWIKWEGGEWGECPVPDGTLIDVEYRDGERKLSLPANTLPGGKVRDASVFFWYNEGAPNDIIAYRIVNGD